MVSARTFVHTAPNPKRARMNSTKPPADDNPTVTRRVICARCGTGFDCGPAGECWCMAEAVRLPMPALDSGEDCLCPTCLRAAAASA